MNAVVASGTPASDYASGFDTAWIDFSKGLGAPVGAVLAGSRELIEEAWRHKQMMGGALRQSGVLAAACLHALDHHVERLAEDHANARLLADGLAELPGVTLDPGAVDTNIVIVEIDDAPTVVAALLEAGVQVTPLGPRAPACGHPPGRGPRRCGARARRLPGGAGGLSGACPRALLAFRAVPKVCYVCKKGPAFGHSRSHSMVATKRRFNPNLQKVRIDVGGSPTREYVCTRCLKAGKVTKAA